MPIFLLAYTERQQDIVLLFSSFFGGRLPEACVWELALQL